MKKEYVILLAIIVALSLYLILHNPDRTRYELPVISEIAKTDISRIEISGQDATISLNRKDNKWYLVPEGYTADTDRVQDMIEIIEKLTGKKAKRDLKPFHKADLKSTWADITKAKKLLKWKPTVTPQEGVERLYRWVTENKHLL